MWQTPQKVELQMVKMTMMALIASDLRRRRNVKKPRGEEESALRSMGQRKPRIPKTSLVTQLVKNPTVKQETLVWLLGQEDPLEEE